MLFKTRRIPIELDKKRYLRLDLQGMVAFELATKKPIFLPSTIEKLKPGEIGILLWCCLIHEGLSFSEVKGIVHGLNKDQWNELAKKLPIVWRDATK